MKKTVFLLSFFILSTNTCLKAQYGLQIASMVPAGKTAYLLKPGYGGEFILGFGDIDNRWKFTANIGFYSFKPTQDTFKTYTIESSQTTSLLPATDVIKKYQMLSFGFGSNFKILDKKFSPIIGMDAYVTIIDESEDSNDGVVNSSSTNDTYWRLSICPKVGACYQIKESWLLNAVIGRDMGFGLTGTQSYWKPSFSASYYFD